MTGKHAKQSTKHLMRQNRIISIIKRTQYIYYIKAAAIDTDAAAFYFHFRNLRSLMGVLQRLVTKMIHGVYHCKQ